LVANGVRVVPPPEGRDTVKKRFYSSYHYKVGVVLEPPAPDQSVYPGSGPLLAW
jgi:hypothetical protein